MTDYTDLLSALEDVSLLPSWIASHDINQEIIVSPTKPAGDIANQSLVLDNRGSPLLIAVELDSVEACSLLLDEGADVNYRHPAKHGNCPLLRAAEMGLSECFSLLLYHPSVDMAVTTNEYKLVLGQNIPQYEAGGRSALLLAVESLQLDIVDIILGNAEACKELLEKEDSFSRTPLEASFEVLALRQEGSEAHTLSNKICHLLCSTATPGLYNSELAFELMASKHYVTKQSAAASLRDRNRILRSRYLQASQKAAMVEREQGMKMWHENYHDSSRQLHPTIYSSSFDLQDLLLPPVLLTGTTTTDDDENISEIVSRYVIEPIPGTFSFPLLTDAYCAKLYAELLHYESLARGNPSLQLPLYIRHDGNMGQLESCGYQPVLKAIETIWQPLLARFMPEKGECEVYHAFLTRNWVGRDENATFKTHCDKSDLTFNICLHASEGFEGSTVGFFTFPNDYTVSPDDPTTHRVYTHTHHVGHAVMHDGTQWHRTDAITKGTRASLIIWARRKSPPPLPPASLVE